MKNGCSLLFVSDSNKSSSAVESNESLAAVESNESSAASL